MHSDWKSKFSESLANEGAIAIWRLPLESEIRLLQAEDVFIWDGHPAKEEEFLFAPFNTGKYPVISLGKASGIRVPALSLQVDSVTQAEYENWVEICVDAIKKGKFSKLVGARIRVQEINDYKVLEHFEKILEENPSAFCYIFHSNQTGTWLGASPEILLELEGLNYKTVALAGTQKASAINFSAKEDEEQEFVVSYLLQSLVPFCETIEKSEKAYHKSGHLLHLQSVFTGQLKVGISITELLSTIHPTPAVAGIPKVKAIEFIEEREGFDRNYYSGFLGPISSRKANLYVNLRCLQNRKNKLVQYAGAGLTAKSIPTKEWIETEEKLKVVAPC